MTARHSWKTLATAGVLLAAGIALIAALDHEALGMTLIAAALGIVGVTPQPVVDRNGNGKPDGTTNPPPPMPEADR